MRVRDFSTASVVEIDGSMSVAEAARRMREQHVGALVVVEASGEAVVPVGIITDRDIVIEVVAAGVDPGSVTVADVMSREPVTCGEDEELYELIRTMSRTGVRRIPVVSPEGALVGIVTADDVLGALGWHLGELTRALRHGQAIERRLRG